MSPAPELEENRADSRRKEPTDETSILSLLIKLDPLLSSLDGLFGIGHPSLISLKRCVRLRHVKRGRAFRVASSNRAWRWRCEL